MRPLVSVIIPVYNTAKYLERCIQSVLSSSYGNLEILAIDDGSTDGSGEILDRLAETDKRLIVVHQENQGVAASRNKGLDLASGTFLTFVDSDDYIGENYIRRFVSCMKKNAADMAICGLCLVDEKDKVLRRLVPGDYIRFQKEEWPMRISAVAAHFYRRSLWTDSGMRFFPGARGEDMPVALYFSAVCSRIVTVSSCDYYYVQHKSSAMHHFRGLKDFSLPYQALRDVFERVDKEGAVNSRDFYELFVLRIFCTCAFDLARGSDKEKKHELAVFIDETLNQWFPDYQNNPLLKKSRGLDLPFVQRMAVRVFVYLQKNGLLEKVI